MKHVNCTIKRAFRARRRRLSVESAHHPLDRSRFIVVWQQDAELTRLSVSTLLSAIITDTQSALTMSASMPSGLVVGAYRSMVLPSLPTKNFAKFHLTSEPAMAIKPLSDLLSFSCFQNGLAFAPFTSIFANSGNLAPYLPANALISAAEPLLRSEPIARSGATAGSRTCYPTARAPCSFGSSNLTETRR